MGLSYEAGTVVVADPSSIPDYITFDSRTASYRSEGYLYSRLKADFPNSADRVFSSSSNFPLLFPVLLEKRSMTEEQ